MYQWRWYFS